MYAVQKILKTYQACKRGATAIEYGLILGLMAIAIVSALTSTGDAVSGSFQAVNDQVEAAKSSP